MSKCSTPRPIHWTVAMMLRSMMREPRSVNELAEETGLARESVRRYIVAFLDKRVVHVSDWEEDSRGLCQTRKFSLGNLPDRLRPVGQRPPREMRNLRQRLRRHEKAARA